MLLYRRLGVIFPLARLNHVVPYSSVRAAQKSSPDEPSTAAPVGGKIQVLVDQIAGLSLLEVRNRKALGDVSNSKGAEFRWQISTRNSKNA